MDKEKMVLYLGYAALALIGIYFTFGILKISGEGLSKLGYPNNFIQEGFSEKEEKEKEKKLKELKKNLEGLDKNIEKGREKLNAINDIPEYGEVIEGYKTFLDVQIRSTVQNAIFAKNGLNEQMMKYIKMMIDQRNLLENYTI